MFPSIFSIGSVFLLCILSLSHGSSIPRSIMTNHHHVYMVAKKSNANAIQNKIKNENPFDRLPRAVGSYVSVAWQSLLSNSLIMVPLCLLVGAFRGHKTVNIWLEKSVIAGLEWGVISSVYAGAEEFLKVLRNCDDVFNRSLASGLASGFFQFRSEGLKGFGVGFLSGFAFVYVFDQLIPLPPPADEAYPIRQVVRAK